MLTRTPAIATSQKSTHSDWPAAIRRRGILRVGADDTSAPYRDAPSALTDRPNTSRRGASDAPIPDATVAK